MTHSPAFKTLFIELFPQHAMFLEIGMTVLLVNDSLTPESVLACSNVAHVHQLAKRQLKIDKLRMLFEQDKNHLSIKVNS